MVCCDPRNDAEAAPSELCTACAIRSETERPGRCAVRRIAQVPPPSQQGLRAVPLTIHNLSTVVGISRSGGTEGLWKVAEASRPSGTGRCSAEAWHPFDADASTSA